MKQRSQNIIIANGALKRLPNLLKKAGAICTIVTDTHMQKVGEELRKQLQSKKISCHMLVIPSGEANKNLGTIEKMANALIKFGMKRDSTLIALGGGVVGDMAGFLASIYMRGIPFVLIPTTLLSMADSCIGGKNGIDFGEAKNMIGTFYQPETILLDPQLLKTLPDRQFRSGMAEIIKHAIIADSVLFSTLEKKAAAILKRSPTALLSIIKKSVQIKLKIVKSDEKESPKKAKKGVSRMLLNYGHTVGHALEKVSNFSIPHGEAVAIGMVAENRIAVDKKMLKESDALRIEKILRAYKLPTAIPESYADSTLTRAMKSDKKHVDGKLYFALPTKIGRAKMTTL